MAPDYDLSNLETSQVDLWIYLQVDAIRAEILADQAKRLGFPLTLGGCIVSVVTEKLQAILNNEKCGADRWVRLRKQNWED